MITGMRRNLLPAIMMSVLCLVFTAAALPAAVQATEQQVPQQSRTATEQQEPQQNRTVTEQQEPQQNRTATEQQEPQQIRTVTEQQMPHLIQTVSDQDVYEGMLELGLMRTPVLEAEDCEQAYENVKTCVVRVQMGKAHGSGIIWKLTPGMVVIATNKHVLEYWNDMESYVYFPQGYYVDAEVLGVSVQYDVGFIAVDLKQFTYKELMGLHTARAEEEVYDGLNQGDAMFSIDAGSDTQEARFYVGTVEEPYRYIEDFDASMLYCHGFAKEGMSGGGTFDGRGYLIGMTTGGTRQNEVACVPLSAIGKAYEEIMHEAAMIGQTVGFEY